MNIIKATIAVFVATWLCLCFASWWLIGTVAEITVKLHATQQAQYELQRRYLFESEARRDEIKRLKSDLDLIATVERRGTN